ncbi:HEPN domain-containing protein [Candidatus Woesearchaeota archaeon]|nr:HEPN domain-containing protein [Candidatus Woesearchaeota archaeon]
MIMLNKSQAEIAVKKYKSGDKVKITLPDGVWAQHHLNKAEYNLRMARINFALNKRSDMVMELEGLPAPDAGFKTFEWVIIMSYYAMFHAVNGLLRKIGIKVGKEHAHEVTANLLLYYFYFTRIIEEELLKIYETAEEKAKEMVGSYIFAKEQRMKSQYGAEQVSEMANAEKVMDDASLFVSRLKDIEKNLIKDMVLQKLGKREL